MVKNENISFEFLSGRFGPAFAQEVCDRLDGLKQRDIAVFDIMELNNLAGNYRVRIKELIAVYRHAQGKTKGDSSSPRRVYASWEMVFMRRQISDLWAMFQMTRADSRELTAEYLRRLNANAYKLSLPTEKVYRAAA